MGNLIENEKKQVNSSEVFMVCNKKYSAPEIIRMANSFDKHQYYNPFKADVFSLGIVILEMMGCNNKSLKSMRENKFERFNPYMEVDYPNLFPIVKEILLENPSDRLDFKEILRKCYEIEERKH